MRVVTIAIHKLELMGSDRVGVTNGVTILSVINYTFLCFGVMPEWWSK
ncbi:MAG: hypothetical protein RMY34_29070 [Aulosira sp. DedQUE10]|nr:hypothetical protein [Aulosira sp. DedQUE10]